MNCSWPNSTDSEAAFLDLHLFISFVFVSSKIYIKRDVNFPFLDGEVPRAPSNELTFLILFGLLEFLIIWLTSMRASKL